MKISQHTTKRMENVQTPIIPVIGKLIENNPGTISLAQGVVYYSPPQQALDKIASFGNNTSNHRYGPVQGVPELIDLIEKKLSHENSIDGDLSKRIIVTAGANMAFLNALFAITDPGDEVILPTPYYFNQEMAIRMINCEPVLVNTDSDFQIHPEQLHAAITPKTRAIVTISPNNPAGVVYPKHILLEINDLCCKHNIYHICDEAYEYFTYGDSQHFSPSSLPGAQDHTISLYSLSKAYGFASWRIGYMLIPEKLYSSVIKSQDTNLICASIISQTAAIGAMEVGPSYCDGKIALINETRKLILNELESVRDFCTFPTSQGAFYFLLNVETSLDSMSMVNKLIKDYKVAVLPGQAFGIDQGCYLRISYGALGPESAIEGIRRLTKGLNDLCHKS